MNQTKLVLELEADAPANASGTLIGVIQSNRVVPALRSRRAIEERVHLIQDSHAEEAIDRLRFIHHRTIRITQVQAGGRSRRVDSGTVVRVHDAKHVRLIEQVDHVESEDHRETLAISELVAMRNLEVGLAECSSPSKISTTIENRGHAVEVEDRRQRRSRLSSGEETKLGLVALVAEPVKEV